jgi:hypothetical protein
MCDAADQRAARFRDNPNYCHQFLHYEGRRGKGKAEPYSPVQLLRTIRGLLDNKKA